MTVAAVVKVFDGLVLATDSATTVQLPSGAAQVYNNADKIFHLHRDLPIAAMTWGLGQIGAASISSLAKDLRRLFMGLEHDGEDWTLDPADYKMEDVAKRTAAFLQKNLRACYDEPASSSLGMLVAGYSAGAKQAETWKFFIQDPNEDPVPVIEASEDASGWQCYAQPGAAERLFRGWEFSLARELFEVVPQEHHEAVREVLVGQARQPVIPAMPFPDAIALAKFLVEVTSGYTHFLLGPDTVGGPIEVAGINRHEGFKWISRKHYYTNELNQGGPR